jgi:serine O-acetyltransferase
MLLGLHAFARWCYLHRIPFLPRAVRILIRLLFNCLIDAPCSIGKGTRLWHNGWCTGIHPNVEIGRDCNIYNQVEIGGGSGRPDGPPIRIIIEDRVNICAGAKVFCKSGTLRVGSGSTIGANAVVLSDVPPDSLAVGAPARCIPKSRPAHLTADPALSTR